MLEKTAKPTSNPTWKEIDQAAAKALGETHCFSCNSWKKSELGKRVTRGKTTQLRCFSCLKKLRF